MFFHFWLKIDKVLLILFFLFLSFSFFLFWPKEIILYAPPQRYYEFTTFLFISKNTDLQCICACDRFFSLPFCVKLSSNLNVLFPSSYVNFNLSHSNHFVRDAKPLLNCLHSCHNCHSEISLMSEQNIRNYSLDIVIYSFILSECLVYLSVSFFNKILYQLKVLPVGIDRM